MWRSSFLCGQCCLNTHLQNDIQQKYGKIIKDRFHSKAIWGDRHKAGRSHVCCACFFGLITGVTRDLWPTDLLLASEVHTWLICPLQPRCLSLDRRCALMSSSDTCMILVSSVIRTVREPLVWQSWWVCSFSAGKCLPHYYWSQKM